MSLLTISPAGAETPSRFQTLSDSLREAGVTHPVAVIDLDALDRNIATVSRHLGAALDLRLVEKSLPSVELLKYIAEHAGTRRIMTFHPPFLPELLRNFPGYDFLMGKSVPSGTVTQLFAQLSPEERNQALRQITWLAGDAAALDGLAQEAARLEITAPLKVALELEIGLRRGGISNREEAAAAVQVLRSRRGLLKPSGIMGYDGHVAHFPAPGLLQPFAMHAAFREANQKYRDLWTMLQEMGPELFSGEMIRNGAGSLTYPLYHAGDGPAELAIGSAFLMGSDVDFSTLKEHVPAVFVATPILKRMPGAQLPFIENLLEHLPAWLTGTRATYVIYGGGWAEKSYWPSGFRNSPLLKDGHTPQIPNQDSIFAHGSAEASPGDFVFFRPHQSDAIFQFEEIWLTRGTQWVGRWKPFTRRY